MNIHWLDIKINRNKTWIDVYTCIVLFYFRRKKKYYVWQSIFCWTLFHKARIFPAPKPVAPRRSINSKKKVSLLNIDLVKICKRILIEIRKVVFFCFHSFYIYFLFDWSLFPASSSNRIPNSARSLRISPAVSITRPLFSFK